MKQLLQIIGARRLAATTGLLLLLVLIWVVGSWIGISANTRFILILVVMVLWGIFLVLEQMRAARGAANLEKSLKAQAEEQMLGARPEKRAEIENLRAQLTRAIESLKRSRLAGGRGGRAALYAFPWYVIIGPPAAGKTTAIRNSGLDFPVGDHEIQGVGGTRNCDWWFTDSAILLDTAGRYTTEDEDREEWLTFLDILKKHRRRQPINGVLVAISIADLLNGGEQELKGHARNIRKRIDELIQRLGVRFPVYLVFTKCDLISGFAEFFEEFTKNERQQVWGCTFPKQQGMRNPRSVFDREFQRLCDSLVRIRTTLLAAPMKRDKRRGVYGFPLQFQSMRDRIGYFISNLFQPNPYQESPLFRGFYFTSATQEGVPIDRVIDSIVKLVGLPAEMTDHYVSETETKTYFIEDLLTDVVFPDQTLVSLTSKSAQVQRLIRFGAIAVTIFVLAVVVLGVSQAFVSSKADLNGILATAKKAERIRWASASDIQSNLQVLDLLRGRIEELEVCAEGFSLTSFGMERCHEVLGPGYDLYVRKAMPLVQQFIYDELETRLRTMSAPREQSYNYLKSYLLLGSESRRLLGPEGNGMDTLAMSFLNRQCCDVVTQQLPQLADKGELRALLQRQIQFFLRCFVQTTGSQNIRFKNDLLLVQKARKSIYEAPSIQSLYTHLKLEANERLQPFGLPGTDMIMSTNEVPGAFTKQGWDSFVEKAIEIESTNPGREDWVLNVAATQVPETMRNVEEIARSLRQLYFAEYSDSWWNFLRGIKFQQFRDVQDAAARLKTFTGSGSPLVGVLRQVGEQTRLQSSPGSTLKEKVKGLFASGQDGLSASDPGFVDRQFESFHTMIGMGEKNETLPELDNVLGQLRAVGESLEKLNDDEGKKGKEYAARVLKQEAGELPDAMKSIGSQLSRHNKALRQVFEQPLLLAWGTVLQKAQTYLNGQWKLQVFDPYQQTLASYFPFKRSSTQDAPPEDIARFFDSQGTFMKFFESELTPFITRGSWQPVTWLDKGIQLSGESRTAFQQAGSLASAVIRSGHIEVAFDLMPQLPTRDAPTAPLLERVCIEVGGDENCYTMGQPRWKNFVWPGQLPNAALKAFSRGSLVDELSFSGEWSLFRLLSRATATRLSSSEYEYKWKFKNYSVRYVLKAKSAYNRFAGDLFAFQCPLGLN